MRKTCLTFFKRLQQTLRQMVGVPDYDNYVQHYQKKHAGQNIMTYEEFFRERQLNRYDGRKAGKCC